MKTRTIVVYCLVVLLVGFLAGTEYQHNSSLEVDAVAVPGLKTDLAIYTNALQTMTDPIERAHVKSQISLIELQIARASRK